LHSLTVFDLKLPAKVEAGLPPPQGWRGTPATCSFMMATVLLKKFFWRLMFKGREPHLGGSKTPTLPDARRRHLIAGEFTVRFINCLNHSKTRTSRQGLSA